MVKGFLALRDHAEEFISFVEMSMVSGIDLPCFSGRDRVLSELKERFKLELSKNEARDYMLNLIDEACDNWRTRWYDKF
jgi:phosphatidylinositol kinase/protein kinase (PI-3  family)